MAKVDQDASNPDSVADAFREDVNLLLRKFCDCDSLRFSDFAKCWCELNFASIFCGRRNTVETMYWSEKALSIARQFWFPPHTLQMRVGAQYVLYGLFFKQPLKNFAKIRVTLEEWKDVMELDKDLVNAKHEDARYTLYKLIKEKAFLFVAVSEQMEMRESLSKARKKVNEPSSVSRLLSALQHNDANFLPAMKKYHEKYVELKRKLADENPEMKETLRLVPDEFPTQLQEGFVLGGAGGISQPRVLPPPGSTTTQHPQEHIGVRRSKLIERAFAGAVPTRMVAKCLNAEESPTKIAEECDSSTGKGDGNSKTAESPKSRRDILVSCERDSLPSENSDVQDHSDDEEIILPHAPT